jgi:hypothetical protein
MIITKEQVEEIFNNSKEQGDYIFGMYKLVIPKWDTVENVGGYPKCGKELSLFCIEKAIDWDKKHLDNHKVALGGAWINWGFSTLDNDLLKPWEVDISHLNITYVNIENKMSDVINE